jgi:hypothetical protein
MTELGSKFSSVHGMINWAKWQTNINTKKLQHFGARDFVQRGLLASLPKTIVIWLILPVVICLFQRLSHACLSISELIQ